MGVAGDHELDAGGDERRQPGVAAGL
jgi:hypothetical protein